MTREEFFDILNNGSRERVVRHRSDPEHDLQKHCVNWFRLSYKDVLIWANGNGGKRDVVTGAKMKAEGVLAGVLDLTIAAARKGYHGLYIEMKNGKKGVLSRSQKDMIEYLRAQGYKAEVARTFDEFTKIVKEYLD